MCATCWQSESWLRIGDMSVADASAQVRCHREQAEHDKRGARGGGRRRLIRKRTAGRKRQLQVRTQLGERLQLAACWHSSPAHLHVASSSRP
jgi:hypothetical protein